MIKHINKYFIKRKAQPHEVRVELSETDSDLHQQQESSELQVTKNPPPAKKSGKYTLRFGS